MQKQPQTIKINRVNRVHANEVNLAHIHVFQLRKHILVSIIIPYTIVIISIIIINSFINEIMVKVKVEKAGLDGGEIGSEDVDKVGLGEFKRWNVIVEQEVG